MIPSSEIIVIAGFVVSVLAAVAAAAVVKSPALRACLFILILVVAGASGAFYTFARRTADHEIERRVAELVGQKQADEAALSRAVDEALAQRLERDRRRQATADSIAAMRAALLQEEVRAGQIAAYEDSLRRAALKSAEEARQLNALRAQQGREEVLERYRGRLVGKWVHPQALGCRLFYQFGEDGSFRMWTEGGWVCKSVQFALSRFEVLDVDRVRVYGQNISFVYGITFDDEDTFINCGPAVICLNWRFERVAE